jgi:hypothetical protein
MFGSLVVVFPTPHEGGALLVRHCNQEWTFDSSREFKAARQPTIDYVVLLNDVEHEVMPVISGHRVTLTYNLYRDVDDSTSARDSAEDPFSLLAYERAFRESLQALLENPEFLAYGGTLGFGLRHSYPVERDIKHVYSLLKASDAIVYRSLRVLGFQPTLYLYHEWDMPHRGYDVIKEGGLIDRLVDFRGCLNYDGEFVDITRVIRDKGGHVACRDDSYRAERDGYEKAETIEWVTPVTKFSRQKSAYATYGNSPSLDIAYLDLCLVVRIGKFGERWMYPTIAQLKKELERDDMRSPFWHR